MLPEPWVALRRVNSAEGEKSVHDVQTGETHMAMQLLIFTSALATPTGQMSRSILFTQPESHSWEMKAISQRGQASCELTL